VATAVAVPLVVVAALLFARLGASREAGGGGSASPSALPPVAASAPPSSAAAEQPCAQVLSRLPVALDGLPPRVVHTTPSSPFVVAWGNPAIVLRCGVPRPARLTATSGLLGVDGVYFLPVRTGGQTVFTAIDRAVYVEVDVPTSYSQPPLGPLATAIAKSLPAVCKPQALAGEIPPPTKDLCTHRK
jgi:hypothetical protein